MGRTPKPVERLKLTGGYRPDRHGTDHPSYPVTSPDAPGLLLDAAREDFDRLADLLTGSGVMGEPHATALALLCNSLARYREASELVERDGPVVETSNGPKRNPALMALNRYHDEVMGGLREFGLSPASVGKVAASKKQPQDPDGIGAFLNAA